MTQIQQGMCKVLRLHVGWASKHIKEMKLKLSCVLDSSPIYLTNVRIKMLMIIYYRLVTCSLKVNVFATVRFCLVKMFLKMFRWYFYSFTCTIKVQT